MLKCNENCEPICDFCIHYKDYSKINGGNFQGDGICLIKNKEVEACDSYNDAFHCFMA